MAKVRRNPKVRDDVGEKTILISLQKSLIEEEKGEMNK